MYPEQLTGAYLTRIGPNGNPTAELAREVPTQRNGGISHDGRTIVYHLRSNLRWSDGSPLTSDDVLFTVRQIIGPNSPVASTAGWDAIASVSSPRAGDVVFRLKRPLATATITFFSSFNGYSILPEHLLRGVDLRTASFNALPVGAGPFRYVSYRRSDRIVMEANPYYFRGRPKLDRIIDKLLPDENTVTTQLLTGEIDLAIRVQPTQLAALRGRPDVSLQMSPSLNTGFIGFQDQRPPFNDRRVREALRLAVDRRRILATVYHGIGSVWDDPVSLLDPFFGGGIAAEPADPKRAGALLDAAGWRRGSDGLRRRNGQSLTIDFIEQTGNEIGASIAELVRADWANIGVTMSTRALNGDLLFSPGGAVMNGDFSAVIYGSGILSTDLASTYTCDAIPPHGYNYSRLCDPRVDALVHHADSIYDEAERRRAYLRARRLIADDAPDIPTIHREDVFAIRNGVTGFHPAGLTIFDDVMNLDTRYGRS
jgi:peptide/nickel transport system substrate-binding protein